MIYYNNSQTCIIYLEEKSIAYLAIEGYLESKTVKEFTSKIMELFSKKNIKKTIIDSSKLEIIQKDDIKLMAESFNSLNKKGRKQKIGYIRPHSIIGEISLEKLIKESSLINFKKFNNYKMAESYVFSNLKDKKTA